MFKPIVAAIIMGALVGAVLSPVAARADTGSTSLGSVAVQPLPQCFANTAPVEWGTLSAPFALEQPLNFRSFQVTHIAVSASGFLRLLPSFDSTSTSSFINAFPAANPTSGTVTYGQGSDGIFCAVWSGMTFASDSGTKQNTFQVLISPRGGMPGRVANDFDIIFNYDSVQYAPSSSEPIGWEVNNQGGFYLPGDDANENRTDNGSNALITHSYSSERLGRYVTRMTNVASASNPGLLLARTPELNASSTKTGSQLSAQATFWEPLGVTFSYQWLRDGVAISGATARTYVITSADTGHALSATVTGSLPYYSPESRTSVAVDIPAAPVSLPDSPGAGAVSIPGVTHAAGSAAVTPATALKAFTVTLPKVKGTAKVGKTLKASVKKVSKAKVSYVWTANGKVITKATKSSLKLTKKLAGKKIVVKVTYKKSGYKTLVRKSKSVKVKK